MSKHGMKARIARELGISGAAVSKLARQGMPTDDADAARRWRAANLHKGRMRPDPGPSADTLLQRAQNLASLAEVALRSQQFDVVANDLRMAMHSVPKSHRARLILPFALWRELIGPYEVAVLDTGSAEEAHSEHVAAAAVDDDDQLVADVCYALACGEAYIK